MITLIIPGKPLGKQRPRVLKNGITYTPAQTVNYETYIKQLFATEYKRHEPFRGPVKMQITAYFPIPQSVSEAKKTLMARGNIRPTKKPDVDNIIKIICDALNGLAYQDDKQIVECTVEKYYSTTPQVQVTIEEV
ncbi:RusA family crossover junction endodeoxyribonuclease [Caldicoprobacter algeriensis]|uniref:RusA family crossover junction endodeoxyribonuclease n=1 Tax=Caldicoprobacter algeriensis TaxID=699281 RepID=UPI00207AA496